MAGAIVRRLKGRVIALSISTLILGIGINYLWQGGALGLLLAPPQPFDWQQLLSRLLFPSIFIIAGLASLVAVLRRRWSESPSGTPWKDNPAWRDNCIGPQGVSAVWGTWLVVLLWCVGSYLAWPHTALIRQGEGAVALAPHLLPLTGLAIFAYAVVYTRRWRRFRHSAVTLMPFPGELGGRVSGQLTLALAPGETLELALSCVHIYWERSGNDNTRSRREKILWQDRHALKVEPGPRAGLVAFDFRPPAELPQSSDMNEHYEWRLHAAAKLKGPDLAQQFVIPVFGGEEHSTDGASGAMRGDELPKRSVQAGPLLPEWLQPRWRDGGLELHLPVLRNIGAGVTMILVGAVFAAVGALMVWQGSSVIAGGLLALGAGAVVLAGIYSLGNSLQLHVSRHGVRLVRRIFGLPIRRNVPRDDIRALDKHLGSQGGDRAYYRIYITTQTGKRHTLTDSVPGESAADYLVDQLSQALGLAEVSGGEQKAEAGS